MPTKLNERSVAAIEPVKGKDLIVWDEKLKGFGVRVSPAGTKTFVLNYTIKGRERRYRIGRFGAWTAAAARDRAEELRQMVDGGEDPQSAKMARRTAPTVRELADRYIRDHLPRKAERSRKEDRTIIEKEILPRLGDRKVADVHHGDIEALHRALTERGVPVRANRVLAVASKMFSLSLLPLAGEDAPWRDRAQGNPCQGVERNQEEGLERFLSPAEIAALSDAIAAMDSTPAINCVKLVMLTGCRPGEALAATWPEFDAEPGVWTKPSAHTKRRKVHRVPLSAGALELLEQVRKARKKSARAKASPYVFPGQKPGEPIKQLRSTKERLYDHATVSLWRASKDRKVGKLVADLEASLKRRPTAQECLAIASHQGVELPPYLTDSRLYDLRHTFASIGAGGGLSLQVIGKLLGHTQARTTQRYAHLADDPLREAVKTIGGVIAGAGKAGADVVPIRQGR